jgi:pilus assembly protein Flp/PilA
MIELPLTTDKFQGRPMRLFRSFLKDINGATAVEYGLVAAVVSVTIIAALGNYYDVMNNMFGNLSSTYVNAGK